MNRNEKGQFVRDPNGESFLGIGVWHDKKGYPIFWFRGKSVKIHVYVWELNYGEKPKGFDIHHKDFNKKNYDISNLELLSYSDHQKLHAGWVRNCDGWIAKPCTKCKKILPLDEFYSRKGYTPTALCKKCHCAQTKVWSLVNHEKRKKIARDWARKHRKGVMPNA